MILCRLLVAGRYTGFIAATSIVLAGFLTVAGPVFGHDPSDDPGDAPFDWPIDAPQAAVPAVFTVPSDPGVNHIRLASQPLPSTGPVQTVAFEAFTPAVKVRWDEQYLYIESDGLPAHGMMVGITSWQQQVPLPQHYAGANAWRIPLHPVPAAVPQTIKNHFLRGAIAIAANGIPIFNPQNNRGEISQEIGELDQWGGHSGRADDYHYHVVPLHLQALVGPGNPVAYALDGYPIYGLTEPDGSPVGKLDECNGHTTAALGYHYHASNKYPYVIGAFHGEVVERDGQVDPQPRAQPVRPSTTPLRGAVITGFTASPDKKNFTLQYTLNGRSASVNYAAGGIGAWKFRFVNADGTSREVTYQADGRNSGPPPPEGRGPPSPPRGGGAPARDSYVPKRSGSLVLHSPAVADGGPLPADYTGDGTSATLPLDWHGAPDGTKAYVVIMHHVDPEGVIKWYWILYNIPADVQSLPKNVKGVGTLGNNSVDDRIGYAPPHSKGPGPKTYVLTVYALSAPVQVSVPPSRVNREVLLAAMKDLILDSAELKVVYDRTGLTTGSDDNRPDGGRGGQRRGNPGY